MPEAKEMSYHILLLYWFHWPQIVSIHSNLIDFQYRCIGSLMFRNENPTRAAWFSRDGTAQIYWGGATSRRDHYCACGETSEFFNKVKALNLLYLYSNCNYILFIKLPWPGDGEGIFRPSSQAATCPPVYHTRRRLHTVPSHSVGVMFSVCNSIYNITSI